MTPDKRLKIILFALSGVLCLAVVGVLVIPASPDRLSKKVFKCFESGNSQCLIDVMDEDLIDDKARFHQVYNALHKDFYSKWEPVGDIKLITDDDTVTAYRHYKDSEGYFYTWHFYMFKEDNKFFSKIQQLILEDGFVESIVYTKSSQPVWREQDDIFGSINVDFLTYNKKLLVKFQFGQKVLKPHGINGPTASTTWERAIAVTEQRIKTREERNAAKDD